MVWVADLSVHEAAAVPAAVCTVACAVRRLEAGGSANAGACTEAGAGAAAMKGQEQQCRTEAGTGGGGEPAAPAAPAVPVERAEPTEAQQAGGAGAAAGGEGWEMQPSGSMGLTPLLTLGQALEAAAATSIIHFQRHTAHLNMNGNVLATLLECPDCHLVGVCMLLSYGATAGWPPELLPPLVGGCAWEGLWPRVEATLAQDGEVRCCLHVLIQHRQQRPSQRFSTLLGWSPEVTLGMSRAIWSPLGLRP